MVRASVRRELSDYLVPFSQKPIVVPSIPNAQCLELGSYRWEIMDKNKRFLIMIAVAVVPFVVGLTFLLTAIFGPSDNGVLCKRSEGSAECEVRQTRFYGLVGNTSFSIPESAIRGAKGGCGTSTFGHAAPSCDVYLILDSGEEYLVAGYTFGGQANAAAHKLNHYFADKSARQLELKEDLLTPVLLYGVAPTVFVTAIMGLRWWKFRSKTTSGQ